MAEKWLDSIEKQRRRIDFLKKERYKQTESTTKNSRLLAGAESTDRRTDGSAIAYSALSSQHAVAR